MTKILVTGATGFIGNHLIPELLQRGCKVVATGTKEPQDIMASWLNQVNYVPYNLNAHNPQCYDLFDKPDKLIHLAWPGLPRYQELFHFEQNLYSSYTLIKSLVLSGVREVVVLGTCFEYGMQNGLLSEDMPALPATAYALAKDTLRKFLEELAKKHPFQLKWVRLFYLYGEGQAKNAILEQLKTALLNCETVFNMSGGEQLRDYLSVEQVAQHLAQIALHRDFAGIINCCSGQPISIRKLVEDYLAQQNQHIELNLGYYPYPNFEPMAFWGCPDKLQALLADNG